MNIIRSSALLFAVALGGCAYNEHQAKADVAYYQAQADRKPLFELEAIEGQTITLQGVKRLTVNDPRANEVKQVVKAPARGWSTLDRVLGLFGQGMSQYGAAKMVLGVADAMGEHAGDRSTHSFVDQSDNSVTDNSTHGSYNDSSDNSQHGPVGSYNQDNDQDNDIAQTGDGSVVGDGNNIDNSTDIDQSDPGDDCSGESCNPITPEIDP